MDIRPWSSDAKTPEATCSARCGDLFKHTKQFMKECPYWISQMGNGYEYLYNWIDRRNWKSMKWLQFLGFEPKDEMKQYGVGKLPFLLMVKEVKK